MTPDSNVRSGDEITFNAAGSSDPDGDSLTFTWNFGDGNTGSGLTTTHSYVQDGEFHRKGSMTPQDFAKEYVEMDWEDYVCIVNDPRNEYYQTYTVDYLQNVAGGPPVVYLNVPSQEMKNVTQKPVGGWFTSLDGM